MAFAAGLSLHLIQDSFHALRVRLHLPSPIRLLVVSSTGCTFIILAASLRADMHSYGCRAYLIHPFGFTGHIKTNPLGLHARKHLVFFDDAA